MLHFGATRGSQRAILGSSSGSSVCVRCPGVPAAVLRQSPSRCYLAGHDGSEFAVDQNAYSHIQTEGIRIDETADAEDEVELKLVEVEMKLKLS